LEQKLTLAKGQAISEADKVTIQAAMDRIEELETALAFYADPDSYFAISIMTDRPCGGFAEDIGEVDAYDREMPGKLAREILENK